MQFNWATEAYAELEGLLEVALVIGMGGKMHLMDFPLHFSPLVFLVITTMVLFLIGFHASEVEHRSLKLQRCRGIEYDKIIGYFELMISWHENVTTKR